MRIRVLLGSYRLVPNFSSIIPYFCKNPVFLNPHFHALVPDIHNPKKLSVPPPPIKKSLFKMTLGPGMQESGFRGYGES